MEDECVRMCRSHVFTSFYYFLAYLRRLSSPNPTVLFIYTPSPRLL